MGSVEFDELYSLVVVSDTCINKSDSYFGKKPLF